MTSPCRPSGLSSRRQAEIEPGGYLHPKTEGAVTVKAAFEGQTATAKITLEPRSSRSWDFAEDIVPILTRLGCNTGSCHGKADGQNGFHLSLFGYDPAGDFQALARDGGQRRLSRLVPEESLFLAKATGRVAHGGGPPADGRLAGISDAAGLGSRRCAGTSRQDARARWSRLTVEPGARDPG